MAPGTHPPSVSTKAPRISPTTQIGATQSVKGKQPAVNTPNPAQPEQPPEWARTLLGSIETLNQRIGLIESGAQRQAFNKVTGQLPGGGVPLTPQPQQIVEAQPVAQPTTLPNGAVANMTQSEAKPKVPMGESGSGYTRLPNGKLVRNKRPQPKPLQLRQAKNWRSTATTNLVGWLKATGIGPDDPKPMAEPQYQNLVTNLAMAKDYMSYVKSNEQPIQVHEWRNAYQGIYTFDAVTSDGNWADEVEASEAGTETASQSTGTGVVVDHETPPEDTKKVPSPVPGSPTNSSGSNKVQKAVQALNPT